MAILRRKNGRDWWLQSRQGQQEAISDGKKWEVEKLSPSHSQRQGERLSILRHNAGYGSAEELAAAMQEIEGGDYPSLKTVQAVECNLKPATAHYLLLFRLAVGDIDIVPPCPTCGSVHMVGDCHGKAGAAAIVAENEEVKQKRIYKMAKRESCYRPRLPLTLKERIEADGRTVEQLIEAALNAKENDE
jgi:hypothetical protein